MNGKKGVVLLAVLVILALWYTTLPAQITGPENILIRNVTLMDPAGKTPDRVVNILIRESKLDVITEDKI